MKLLNIIVASVVGGILSHTAQALEVDREVIPRMTLGGRVISTFDTFDYDSDPGKDDDFNTGDSSILMRFDKRMYKDGIAGAVVGFTEAEETVKFHQLHGFYWDRDFGATIGRTRLRNTIIEFPLLRDDDLLEYTHVGNASSQEEFDQIYASQVAFDWFVDQKLNSIGIWGATRANDTSVTAPDGVDSFGLNYTYEQGEDLLYVKPIRHAGVSIDRQKLTTGSGDEWMTAVIAGIEFNLNEDPTSNWSMGIQAINNNGVSGITTANIRNGATNSVSNRARAKSNSLVASLRYTARPMLLTRWQAAITMAYKDYSDAVDASQWSVAPNYVYKLGQGVDLMAQAKYTNFSNGMGGGSDTAIQVGMSFSLEAIFNDNIGERTSILNLEHGYIQ